MNLTQYIKLLQTRYQTGISGEHSYRGDLQTLLSELLPGILVTNEPARIECGAPDYILTKKDIPVGYIEAKDIGVDLGSKSLKGQFNRYKASLDNLIFTDYLDFHFYKAGNFVTKIAIAEIQAGRIVPLPDNFDTFSTLIKTFADTISQTIKSPNKLAEMMASRAKLMADVIEKSLNADDEAGRQSALKGQMLTFKNLLIHDITNRAFADLYAQTIAYGLFAARYHDPTLPTFSRQEAATLIPKSNPFLRRLFQDIAGYDLDERLVWIVDELVQIFLASDVADIMRNFGTRTKQEDPVIHFYETFLAAYDPALRKDRGVWYTPEPIVNFIVRAVDDILKTEFGITQGLADTSKTKITTKVATKATADRRSKVKEVDHEKEVHRVQILDPAAGTGTFLAEVVKHIHKKFKGQEGIWNKYVENELIPRLHGFELLMASYAMAHLKLDILLTETGHKPASDQRFRVYLTNSLEESHPDTGTLFANWLSEEANEANYVKRETPVMVVLGNPPYKGESSNKGRWIMELMKDFKKEPGGKVKLKEKTSKWINADENKFIRFGQNLIEKNGEGVLAYINPHSYLDNPTCRGMRWHLLSTFDKIYIIDLHGNNIKKEVMSDGSIDANVFNIEQGVCINLFVKTGKKKSKDLGEIFHFDVFGKREIKYDFLLSKSLHTVPFVKLEKVPPNYFFTQKNFDKQDLYEEGFRLNEMFIVNGGGMTTAHDNFVIDENADRLLQKLSRFKNSAPITDDLHRNFKVKKKTGWNILEGWSILQTESDLSKFIQPVTYRPFDNQFIFYEDRLVWRTVRKVMTHFLNGDNLGLVVGRQGQVVGSMSWNLVFITKNITDFNLYYRGGGVVFPLYLYPTNIPQTTIDQINRKPNISIALLQKIAQSIGLKFSNEQVTDSNTFSPVDLLDYIYAVLHSPSYRETYKEYLKIDFPRIPYPKDAKTFRALVALGGELRQVHLLASPVVGNYITQYPEDGDNVVRKVKYEAGNVHINETQYFANVPPVAWEFYIGGYQPAQKWLKDRKDRSLNFEDILHYQKIIVALVETDRLMKEIDAINPIY